MWNTPAPPVNGTEPNKYPRTELSRNKSRMGDRRPETRSTNSEFDNNDTRLSPSFAISGLSLARSIVIQHLSI